jgi:YidC/Oxa1 family membrane protein insertase
MAVGMVLQQRLTPMTGMDPAQAQMMRFMPLVFALFMFGLPAGLSLYYALNTALSILQQWYNTRSYQPLLPSA